MCSISEKCSCLTMPETPQALQNVNFAAKEHVFKIALYKM